MSKPADLAIIMPTYNHGQFLTKALDAIVAQSVPPKEFIIIDDGSTDETPNILADYGRRYPLLRIIRNEPNRGAIASIRLGLELATASYLYFAASDDYILPGFIEKLMAELIEHPKVGLCCSYRSTLIAATGEILEYATGWCDRPRYFTPEELAPFVGREVLPGHAHSIVKRADFEAAGGILPDLGWYSDWFTCYVIAFRTGICHVPEMLTVFRLSPQSFGGAGARSTKNLDVISAAIDCLRSDTYRDVLPYFQRSGVFSFLGLDVVRAAARRSDRWDRDTLLLVHCFLPRQYEELLDDPDPAVRELAAFFLGPFWKEPAIERQCLQENLRACTDHIRFLTDKIKRLESTWPRRVRRLLKGAVRKLLPISRSSKSQDASGG